MQLIYRLSCALASLLILFGCTSNQKLFDKYNIEKSTLDSCKSLPNLENALSDENENIRRQSLHYISRQGISAVHALPEVRYLAENDPSEENRCYAIRVVSRINPDIFLLFWINVRQMIIV
jgi:HEAT repeat protein